MSFKYIIYIIKYISEVDMAALKDAGVASKGSTVTLGQSGIITLRFSKL